MLTRGDLSAFFEASTQRMPLRLGVLPVAVRWRVIWDGYGTKRVAKAVLMSAVPRLMLPRSVFDEIWTGVAGDRSQFYKSITLPFYGYNRPGAKISKGVRGHWWLRGMLGGVKAHYDCIKAFSETDFTEDIKKIDISTYKWKHVDLSQSKRLHVRGA